MYRSWNFNLDFLESREFLELEIYNYSMAQTAKFWRDMRKNSGPILWQGPSEHKIESADYRQIHDNELQRKKK